MKKINTKLIAILLSGMIAVSSLGTAVSADEILPVNGDTTGSVQDIIDRTGNEDEESDGSEAGNFWNDPLQDGSDQMDDEDISDDESRDALHQGVLHFEEDEEEIEPEAVDESTNPNASSLEHQLGEDTPAVFVAGSRLSTDGSALLNPSLALSRTTSGYSRYKFTGADAATYKSLKNQITAVANGNRTSTEFEVSYATMGLDHAITAQELGLDYIYKPDTGYNKNLNSAITNKLLPHIWEILHTLLVDCPFELYWYDKTVGLMDSGYGYRAAKENGEYVLYFSGTNNGITYSFDVSADYSAGAYKVNKNRITAAVQASDNAKAIVQKYSSLSDIEKLTKYKEEICNLVAYDYDTASQEHCYGDAFQMISVFDKNSSTNVVCEGYAKAFKYLCDQSTFSSNDINCIIAFGDFQGSKGAGPHMWNIVSLGNGTNYLVDLTNCDTGTVGYSDQLFMRNATTVNSTYSYSFKCNSSTVTFVYDEEMYDILFNDSALKITTNAMVKAPTITMKRVTGGVKLSWNTSTGAAKYKVYRKTPTTDWVELKDTTALTFTDPIAATDTTTYSYCVRAVASDGSYLNALENSASTAEIAAITISTQPKDYTGQTGTTATFSVKASGSGLTYQWQANSSGSWVNSSLTGSKTATLSVPITAARNGYKFRCVITNSDNISVTSDVATLHMAATPVTITTQPKDYTGQIGTTAKFTVAASGGTGFKYQWQAYSSGKWVNSSLTGSKTATLSVPVTAARDGYKFRCVVTNSSNGTATSNAATLHMAATPITITTQPKDYTGAIGSTAKFTVAVKGGTGFKYQWQAYANGKWSNSSLTGSKTATLSVPITAARNGYKFRCVITNSSNGTATTNAATLKVATTPLAITTQPKSYSGAVGSTATFKVVAQGTGLKYQWQAYSGGKWANSSLTGSKTNTLSVPVTAARNGYKFRCVITDTLNNTVTTNTVTLTVKT